MLLLCFLLKCSLQPSKANKRSCHQLRSARTEQEQQRRVSRGGGKAGALPSAAPGDLRALRLVRWGYIVAPLCLLVTL